MTGLYAADLSRYGDGPSLYRDVFTVTMRLAGRVPDDLLRGVREQMRSGQLPQAIGDLVVISVNFGAKLPAAGLKVIPEETFEPARWIENAPPVGPELSLPPYTFKPLSAEGMAFAGGRATEVLDISGGVPDMPADAQFRLFGEFSDPVTPGYTAEDGILGIWRSWRSGPEAAEPRQVYVAALEVGADALAFIADAERSLKGAGVKQFQVEAYFAGEDVPEYHQNARDNGVLLWARYPGTVHVVAESGGRAGARVPGTDFSTDGLVVWPGPGNGELSTVDDVAKFRALVALRKAGKVA